MRKKSLALQKKGGWSYLYNAHAYIICHESSHYSLSQSKILGVKYEMIISAPKIVEYIHCVYTQIMRKILSHPPALLIAVTLSSTTVFKSKAPALLPW